VLRLSRLRGSSARGVQARRLAMAKKTGVGIPAPNIRRLALAVAGLTAFLIVAHFLPKSALFTQLSYLPLHTALEFIAMTVSFMVFALGWNLRREKSNSHIVLLGAAFLAVAVIDFAH